MLRRKARVEPDTDWRWVLASGTPVKMVLKTNNYKGKEEKVFRCCSHQLTIAENPVMFPAVR